MRRELVSVIAGVGLLLLMAAPGHAAQPVAAASGAGKVRTYYIAADEVDWDYAPSRMDKVYGVRYHLKGRPEARGALDPDNAFVYRKVIYREYTDASFKILKPRSPAWAHLGILGPLIRAEVGDTIKVVFHNNASRAYSIHPHGVFYTKASEGAGYEDGVPPAGKPGYAVAPGATFTYVWQVPERAGPAAGDVSSVVWPYHSHVNEGRDVNSGLLGPIIITRRGMARPDGSPKDVDREFVAYFALFDEHLSWMWDTNIKRLYGDPARYDNNDPNVHDFHHLYTINGFLDGNGPMMTMKQGEHVRWYLMTGTNEMEAWDIHTAHWHGQTVVVNNRRTDMVMLNPMITAVADMVPDNPGIWLFHCHMPGHFNAGMKTLFQILPQ